MKKNILFISSCLLLLSMQLFFYSLCPEKSYAWEWEISMGTTTYDFGRVGLNFSTSTASGYFGVWSSHSSLMELWCENSQDWTKGDATGNEIFCLKALGGDLGSFTSIASTQTLTAGLPKGTTQTFDLELNSPTNTTATLTQNIAVKLQAGLPAGYIYLADGDLYYKNVGYGTSSSDYSSALDTCITPAMKGSYTGWSQLAPSSISITEALVGTGGGCLVTRYFYSDLGGFYWPVSGVTHVTIKPAGQKTWTSSEVYYAGWEDNTDVSLYLLRSGRTTYQSNSFQDENFTVEYYSRNQIVILD